MSSSSSSSSSVIPIPNPNPQLTSAVSSTNIPQTHPFAFLDVPRIGNAPIHVLLCLSGSVAAIKCRPLLLSLHDQGFQVGVVVTPHAFLFLHTEYQADLKKMQNQTPANSINDGTTKVEALSPLCKAQCCRCPNSFDAFSSSSSAHSENSSSVSLICPCICHLCSFLFSDADEWSVGYSIGDPVLHISLRRWTDILLIAPLSANTLAKIALGLCDNLLTCVARAWPFTKGNDNRYIALKEFLVAPAMNTAMYEHPLTEDYLSKLQRLGIEIIPSMVKILACGDKGMGAMAAVDTIVQFVKKSAEKVHATADIH